MHNPPRSDAPDQQSSPAIRLIDGGISRGGTVDPLHCGAMHYWRVPRKSWAAALQSLVKLGVSIVETYVPWGVHENAEGEFDFGERDPNLDLGAFVDEAQRQGLQVFLRPGPHINAELTYFGLPKRVVDNPAFQAQSASGQKVSLFFPPTMFAVPSYASEAYFDEVRLWFDAVGRVIVDRIYPKGPIVMAQVDNEAAFYFRNGPYEQDYHPDALSKWSTYATGETKLGDVDPPQSFACTRADELPLHLAWARFKETLITAAIEKLTAILKTAFHGDIPIVANLPPGDIATPLHLPDLQTKVALVGMDYYHPAAQYETIKARTLYLSGNVDLPFAPEMGVGAPHWFTPLKHSDSLFCAMTALAHGLRGLNLYMAVDRDRWYGAPIDNAGQTTNRAADWVKLFEALKRSSFHRLQRKPRVALVIPREYLRLSHVTQRFGPLNASFMQMAGLDPFVGCDVHSFGFAQPIQKHWWTLVAEIAHTLDNAHITYDYVDSENDPLRLQRYPVVLHPTYEFMSAARFASMHRSEVGNQKVFFGPIKPTLDDVMQPLPEQQQSSAAFINFRDESDLLPWLDSLASQFASEFWATSGLETVVHYDENTPKLLFAINPTDVPIRSAISTPAPVEFRDMFTEEILEASPLLVPEHSCRMLTIQTPRRPSARAKRKSNRP